VTDRTYRVVLAVLLTLTFLGLIGVRLSDGAVRLFLDNLHWTCSFLAATLMAYQGWRQAADPHLAQLRAWGMVGMAAMLIGQVLWSILTVRHTLVFPDITDIFFLMQGPALCIGLWRFGSARLQPTDWRTTKLDAAGLLVATLAVTLALFLPRQGEDSLLQVLVLAAYPISLLAPICLGIILLLKLRAMLTWHSLLLPVSAAVLALTWADWNLQWLTHTTQDGGVVNILFSVCALGMGLGIYGFDAQSKDDPAWDRRSEGILRMLPLMQVLMAAVGVVVTNTLINLPASTRYCVLIGSIAVVIMAFARQNLLLGERDRLIEVERMLRQRETELEARVAARTHDLLKAREAAEAASQAKSDFLANMSHEIRTPLNGVLGFTQLAQMQTQDPDQQRYLDKIQVAGKQLLRLINDILDMSKIEAGKLALEQIRFDLPGVMRSLETQTGEMAKAKGLQLQLSVAPDAAQALLGDPLRMEQILLNYISNAIKFTEQGRIEVHALVLADKGSHVVVQFEVRDTGLGMDAATLARLFTAFEQADNSTTRRFGGSGLGLAICKRLADLMGGEVGADSHLGQGSRFWFKVTLPKATQTMPIPKHADTTPSHTGALEGTRILLTEDNELNQLLACSILEHMGSTVRVARSGLEAIDLLRTEPFDCVLMDIQMPGMDGLTATRTIRTDLALHNLPIIAMTANARTEDRRACLDAGMNDFVSKPFNIEQLRDTLQKWRSDAFHPTI
jgi:signal transduction histidine kinase/CheY-like chemotaxis protein